MSVRWLIERRTAVGLALVFALFAVAGVASYRSLRQYGETTRWLLHTHGVLARIDSGLITLLDIQTGTRGFVLTGDPRYLEPYEHALPEVPTELDRLRQLTADNPRQQKRLDHLELLVPQFIAEMKVGLEIRRRKGFDAAVAQVASGRGKKLMDEIRAVFAEMEEEERQLLKVRTGAAGAGARLAILVSSVSSLLAVLLFVFCFHLVQRQIHRTQQAEIEARDARAYAESIVDTVREPLLVLRGDLRVVSANRSFYEFFQATESETLGRHLCDLGAGQWNLPQLRASLENILPQNGHFHDFEVEHEFPRLGRRTLLLNARKLYHQGNHTQLILLALADITERKRAEGAILRAKEEAERSNRFKDQFLSTMSHELRTPLNAVMGFSELLGDENYGPLNDRQRRYLGHVRNGGQHLLKLINDILDLSRMEAGRLELAPENISVEAVFSEALETIQPLAARRSHTLLQRTEPGLALRADATRFRQILLNLLGNAVKFTPDGGSIELTARPEGGAVRVEVRDTGPGIPLEEQQRIFEAFYRLRSAGQASEEGTGLGLAITSRLVELHGSRLEVQSEPGKGSGFFFRLPAQEFVAQAPQEIFATEPPLILIVEDDPLAAHLIRSQLTTAGYRVEHCGKSERALKMAAELQPAAITLDILMKPVNGWEVLSRLRADSTVAHIPVLIVSVVDQPGVGIALGADDYLVKPVDKSALLTAVRRCLARRGVSVPARPILLVEDDAATREVIGELLASEGLPYASAADGQQARDWVATTLPDLVLLDLVLPCVSGIELLSEWRSNPRTANLPVFVLTGKDLTRKEAAFLLNHTEMLLHKQQSWQQPLLKQLRRVLALEQGMGS
ncbi:MAG: CHASE3 domain-containing protein [Acidobacteria bacterium]|nr:CHASE3 domain-containing protein [Acidobacteriota bacterium]MBI3661890.1 CHASE3 domain-containing protein [Acidobacteriota bacterium]